MTTPLKSEYELVMEQFQQAGQVVTFNEEQSLNIIENLNSGMNDFLYEQKINEKESELELSDLILNS